jgi:phosphopantetheine--protein transferase-like protein
MLWGRLGTYLIPISRFRTTGWSRGVRWVDVEVVRQKSGRPTPALKGKARKTADSLGVKHTAVSITHTADQAFAQVIFEG